MQLHFQAQGEGHPLILLHGFLGSLDNWRAVAKKLAERYRVYALDLRNHGRSPHSDAMDYPAMAEDVGELIGAENLGATHVLGHSMGGKVAMQLALQQPAAVEKLVVVDIAPRAYPPSHRPILAALRALELSACASYAAAADALADAVPDSALRDFLVKNLGRDGGGQFSWRIGLDEIIRNYDSLTCAIATTIPSRTRSCFIRAGRSDFIADADLESIRALFPRAEIVTLADVGHWVHIEAANEFHRLVARFLAEPSHD